MLNWLLLFVPVTLALEFLWPAEHTLIFLGACLAIIPLAGWLGHATEELARYTGEGAGGLLNATFGNAAELIIAMMAIRKGLYAVVKASITGSIIGNILLVLGAAVLAGGVVLAAWLALGIIFHAGVAVTMGLHMFIWSFCATYPAILYVSWHLLGR